MLTFEEVCEEVELFNESMRRANPPRLAAAEKLFLVDYFADDFALKFDVFVAVFTARGHHKSIHVRSGFDRAQLRTTLKETAGVLQ